MFYSICFSPTGGTQKVADILANEFAENKTVVDLTDRNLNFGGISLSEDDVALIAVPSYSGRVPAIAVKRIAAINGNGAKAVLVCVYGNRAYEDTLTELRDTATKAGFRVIASVAAVAEHSILRNFAQGRPDEADRKQLIEFAEQIRGKLLSGNTTEPNIPGNRPYRKISATGMIPKATRACTNCGLCARKCPVGAIDGNDFHHIDREACISCMRCVAICPQKARKVSPLMLFLGKMMLNKACSKRKENELYLY